MFALSSSPSSHPQCGLHGESSSPNNFRHLQTEPPLDGWVTLVVAASLKADCSVDRLPPVPASIALGAATLLEVCGPAVAPAAPTSAPAVAPTAAAAAPTTAPAQATPTVTPAQAAGAAAPQFDDTAAGPVPFRKDTVANALTPKRGGSMTTAWAGGFNWNQWDPMKSTRETAPARLSL